MWGEIGPARPPGIPLSDVLAARVLGRANARPLLAIPFAETDDANGTRCRGSTRLIRAISPLQH
jgi:hypothetical protein